jgi:hypothetical protein
MMVRLKTPPITDADEAHGKLLAFDAAGYGALARACRTR